MSAVEAGPAVPETRFRLTDSTPPGRLPRARPPLHARAGRRHRGVPSTLRACRSSRSAMATGWAARPSTTASPPPTSTRSSRRRRRPCTKRRSRSCCCPGIGLARDLEEVRELGASVARIATHCTEADISIQHLRTARDLGMETVGFLMMAHMATPDELLAAGADHGGRRRAVRLRRRLRGCHDTGRTSGHASPTLKSGLATGDPGRRSTPTRTCRCRSPTRSPRIEAGVDQVDGCTRGLGAGAGNCPTEVLVRRLGAPGLRHGRRPAAHHGRRRGRGAADHAPTAGRRPGGTDARLRRGVLLVPAPRRTRRGALRRRRPRRSCSSSAGARRSAARRT